MIRKAFCRCRICVLRILKNHEVKPRRENDDNPATQGLGLKETAVAKAAATGTDSGGAVDFAAAYVKLLEKGTDKDLGTYLVSQYAAERNDPYAVAERVTADGTDYSLLLHFKRAICRTRSRSRTCGRMITWHPIRRAIIRLTSLCATSVVALTKTYTSR